MAKDKKRKENLTERLRRASGYEPVRRPKLVGIVAVEPPPAPADAVPHADEDGVDRFGKAAEDGLRMLAALETMPSLEPDYCDDLAEEASITIIERAAASGGEPNPSDAEDVPARSLRSRLEDVGGAPDIVADEYAAYQGLPEEATVEIVEVREREPDASRRPRQKDLPRRDGS